MRFHPRHDMHNGTPRKLSSLLSRAAILAAADQIEAEGGTATMAAVRSRLGGGSFTTITAAMSARKKGPEIPEGLQDCEQDEGAQDASPSLPAGLSGRLQGLGDEIWTAALAEAHAHYKGKIAQLESGLSAAQWTLQTLRSALQA